jgi:hypothetical protein
VAFPFLFPSIHLSQMLLLLGDGKNMEKNGRIIGCENLVKSPLFPLENPIPRRKKSSLVRQPSHLLWRLPSDLHANNNRNRSSGSGGAPVDKQMIRTFAYLACRHGRQWILFGFQLCPERWEETCKVHPHSTTYSLKGHLITRYTLIYVHLHVVLRFHPAFTGNNQQKIRQHQADGRQTYPTGRNK